MSSIIFSSHEAFTFNLKYLSFKDEVKKLYKKIAKILIILFLASQYLCHFSELQKVV